MAGRRRRPWQLRWREMTFLGPGPGLLRGSRVPLPGSGAAGVPAALFLQRYFLPSDFPLPGESDSAAGTPLLIAAGQGGAGVARPPAVAAGFPSGEYINISICLSNRHFRGRLRGNPLLALGIAIRSLSAAPAASRHFSPALLLFFFG